MKVTNESTLKGSIAAALDKPSIPPRGAMYALQLQQHKTCAGSFHTSLLMNTSHRGMTPSHAMIREHVIVRRGVHQGKRTMVQKRVYSASSTAGAPTLSTIDENSVLDAVIVGAGISGLTTALVRCDTLVLSR